MRIDRYVLALLVAAVPAAASAQELWKYTDKNGKVTYSDKAPKNGEKAELVKNDPNANVFTAPKASPRAETSRAERAVDRAVGERNSKRDSLRLAVEQARDRLAEAKQALENGRNPAQEEVQIVVGRDKDGKPTGQNTQLRKPEYYERITKLEEAVKAAEAKVEEAEREFRREAP